MKKQFNWISHFSNFLAVILGVLLAFYINEHAKTSSNEKEAEVLITKIIDEISDDIENYENYQIPVNKEILQDIEKLFEKLISNDLEGTEELLANTLQVENYFPTGSTYNSMKVSAKINLIQDLELQRKHNEYYDGDAAESKAKGELQVEYFTQQLLPWLSDNADLSTGKLLNPQNLNPLANRLAIYASLVDQKIVEYEELLATSKELKEYLISKQ